MNNFFSRQDLGGADPDEFHRDLQIANLKQQNADLLEALLELKEKYLFNQTKSQAKNRGIDDTLIKVESVIQKATSK